MSSKTSIELSVEIASVLALVIPPKYLFFEIDDTLKTLFPSLVQALMSRTSSSSFRWQIVKHLFAPEGHPGNHRLSGLTRDEYFR